MKESNSVYQLRVSLTEIEPNIWRTVLVPADYTLGYVHVILQTVMGWFDYHLHQFDIAGKVYGRPDYDDSAEGLLDERVVKLGELIRAPRESFSYTYDFGDWWQLKISLQARLPRDPRALYPICLDGQRAAPPEDVGGTPGYERFLEAIADPSDEEHADRLEWIGGEFDSEQFDLEHINRELRKIFRLLE